jgi:hypothetical protein
MSLTGGKRNNKNKGNKSLKAWVAFVKRVQKEEKIPSYKDAIHRAKQRKDKGEKWMKGGDSNMEDVEEEASEEIIEKNMVAGDEGDMGVKMGEGDIEENMEMNGGRRRRRKTMRRSRKSRKSRRRKTRRRRH